MVAYAWYFISPLFGVPETGPTPGLPWGSGTWTAVCCTLFAFLLSSSPQLLRLQLPGTGCAKSSVERKKEWSFVLPCKNRFQAWPDTVYRQVNEPDAVKVRTEWRRLSRNFKRLWFLGFVQLC